MNRPDWDAYFMGMAKHAASRSEDPSTQVGCIIVNRRKQIVSTGYNGFIAGCEEEGVTYEKPMKYHLVIHAEMNALLQAEECVAGYQLFCTHAPCENCLKHIFQAGIRDILFESSKLVELFPTDNIIATKKLCRAMRVQTHRICDINKVPYEEIINQALRKKGML